MFPSTFSAPQDTLPKLHLWRAFTTFTCGDARASISFACSRPLSFGNGYGNATFGPRTSTFELLLNLRSLANFGTTNYLTPAVVVE